MQTKKIVLWSVVVVLIGGIVWGAIWWLRRPQVITFGDGSKLTLLAVDYGKRHSPPTVKTSGTARRTGRGGAFTTPNDTLVLWLRQECDTSEWHNFQFYVYDKDGAGCVQTGSSYGGNGQPSNQIVSIRIEAFPRRQGKFYVAVRESGNNFNETAEKKFIVSNPAGKNFSNWTAESLPVTKDDEDLSVTLVKFNARTDMNNNRNEDDPEDAANKGAQAVFHIERGGKTVTNWEPVAVETSDATGNKFSVSQYAQNSWRNGWATSSWADENNTFTWQYALWPDEPAWKLRMEFSKQSNFSDYELWDVQNLPVMQGKQQEMWNYNRGAANTNVAFAETDLNGFHVKLYPAKDFMDAGNNNWMQGGLFFDIKPVLPEGMRLAVKVTDPQGGEIPSSQYNNFQNSGVANFRFRLQDVGSLTNLNVSIALHKSRYVEFTVKPGKAEAKAAQ